ncbi:serine hydrolase [Blastococcus sp. TF02-09]|uniref:serine hydrolase n=1 Tax=Blastococcus sp. TF02-09 TaxID=2250576 RepID=UPI0011BDD383|nr:serine hydrolase [Blastococcus sp. TF02-9]
MSRTTERLRRRPRLVLVAVLVTVVTTVSAVVVVAGCTTRPAAASTSSAAAPDAGEPPGDRAQELLARASVDTVRILDQVAAAGAAVGGTIAVVALDSDGNPLVSSPEAGQPRYTASLVKIVLVSRLLLLDAAGVLTLAPDDLALMERAVTSSDDAAMSALWVRFDGARLVADAAASLGLTVTGPPEITGQWGQAWTSASDTATVLTTLDEVLPADDAATLLRWMRATTPLAADGFDQRFGLLAGASDGVAAKQGWMCCVDDRRQLHSAGVLADGRVVVLLGDFPEATTWAQASGALARAADAVRAGIA